jgi:hypothetical protein
MTVGVRFTKWGGRRHWECELEPGPYPLILDT